ncbi:putative quinone oxidoreductase [Lasiodiplodia theobromae]|uniref:putative quinone oxidoreductase n=1 Tax=Lasiodiplodia theobromae TaxID=45133 RepID=UPI0015C331D4|nr:putative quinone oxidoreductase [Lasiodiplodia theobromae]KAF4540346.1 putative quinone oxidoreductase [Lasiodiplodia theobromae]
MSSPIIPQTHRVLKLASTDRPLTIETIPTPRAGPGSAVIRILAALVVPYSGEVYSGKRPYPLPAPFVPGEVALGRIVEAGPDATTLSAPGQLVLFDAHVRGRDDASVLYISGIEEFPSDAGRKLARCAEWRDSTYAQHARVPLENCLRIDETRLRQLGYGIDDELCHVLPMFVPFGGLSDIGLRPGETVAIAPATGIYGGAAVHVALAMGARVVAVGRNEEVLSRLVAVDPRRVAAVRITGDVDADAKAVTDAADGPIDAYLDISSPQASDSTHFRSCFNSLRSGGRVSLMGGARGFPLTTFEILLRALTVKGTWRCTRGQAIQLLKMVEAGTLPLGKDRGMKLVGRFGLDQWEEAFETAARYGSAGETVVLTP